MSIYLMTLAWKVKLQPARKMALLAMCDWANDEGGSLHPSLRRVAERMSCSVRQAQRVLHSLIDDGFISVTGNEHGGPPGASRNYQINIHKLAPETGETGDTGDARRVTPMSRVTHETGDTHVMGRVTSMTQTGDTHVTQSIIDPPIDPPIDKRTHSARTKKPPACACPEDVLAQTFDDWLVVRRAKRAGPVTPTVLAAMRAEAQKAGISMQTAIEHCCLAGWQGFRAEWYKNRTGKSLPAPENFAAKKYESGDL